MLHSLILTLALYDAETNCLDHTNKTLSSEKKKRSQEATNLKSLIQDLVDEVNELVTEVWEDHPGANSSSSVLTGASGPGSGIYGRCFHNGDLNAGGTERPNPLDMLGITEDPIMGKIKNFGAENLNLGSTKEEIKYKVECSK
ncbi:hypothetical protein C8J56DRAFT_898439 [Mycena floridula]|nr:hypothetical protein C8J56DRAFT_898439 [Mycena floridula]